LKDLHAVKKMRRQISLTPEQRPPLTDGFRARLHSDAPGLVELSPQANAIVSVHVGSPARMSCRHGRALFRGTAIHGDVEIIPWGMPGGWELKQHDVAFVMSLSPALLGRAAEESGVNGAGAGMELLSRFHTRDLQIEHIAWALKNEMDNGYPCGRVYTDGLALALAAHLVRRHSSLSPHSGCVNGRMPLRKLKEVLLFVDDHLAEDLSLADIARVAGLSLSHLSALFRASVGMPVHQYVLRRKVERAAQLLRGSRLPISQVALESGFAHQSHLALHMRRIMGTTPKKLRSGVE
jgi:AraC family transcriptional regulator